MWTSTPSLYIGLPPGSAIQADLHLSISGDYFLGDIRANRSAIQA